MSVEKVVKRKYRFLRRMLRILFGLFLFIFLLLVFIKSPWGQSIIVSKAVNYVSDKTNTKISVEKLFITFDGAVQLDGLYLEDKKGDTLIYSKSLLANVPLLGMILGNSVGVTNLECDGLRASIIRKDSVSGYNFQFLLDAFASKDTISVVDETKKKPIDIVFGNLKLNDINVDFKDAVLGIDSKVEIGGLGLEMDSFDLENMIFNTDDISLYDSKIKFIQNKATPKSDTKESVLPTFSAETISIKNTQLFYKSETDNILADAKINDFYTEIPTLNLAKKIFAINTFQLRNSNVLVEMKKGVQEHKTVIEKSNSSTFTWPDVILKLNEISLENNKINYSVNGEKVHKNRFNPDAISLNNLTLKATDIFLKDKEAGLAFETFSFEEKSGINFKKIAFNARISDTELEVSGLDISINKNKIKGFASANYHSISQLVSSPEKTKIKLKFPSFELWLDEVFRFQPSLEKNEYLKKLSAKKLKGTFNVNGTLSNVKVSNTKLNWGNATGVSLNGIIKNVTNTDLLALDFSNFSVKTNRADLLEVVNERKLSIHLPEEIVLKGNLKGGLKNLTADAKLTSSQGLVIAKGIFRNKDSISYDVALDIDKFKLGELLLNPNLGALSLSLKSKGSGKSFNNLNATLETTISEFKFNNYDFKDLKLNGNLKEGKGNIASSYKDANLNLILDSSVELDSIASNVHLNLNLIGANLQALGLLERNVKAGMKVSLDFKGSSEKYNISTDIKNGIVVYHNRTYLLGGVHAKAFVDKDTTSVSLKNRMIDFNLNSNTNPDSFNFAIGRHLFSYFLDDIGRLDTLRKPVNLQIKAKISQTPMLKDVFLVNTKEIDTINVALDFQENKRILKANITAPHINYSDNILDSLSFSLNTDKDKFNFNLGFRNITAGPLNIPKTIITGDQANGILSINFLGFLKGEQLMNVNTKITANKNALKLVISKDSLMFNKQNWTIPEDNSMVLFGDKFSFSNFKISNSDQSIEASNSLPHIKKNHVALLFNNFEINQFFNYLNPKEELFKGVLNGDFIIEEPFVNAGVIANLNIANFKVLKTNFGNLSVDAKSLGNNKYDFNGEIKGGDVNLDLKGDYFVINNKASLNLDLAINEFKMNALNTLSLGEIKETSGSFSGNFKVTGSTSKPIYTGSLKFKDAAFNITKLNNKLTLKDEVLTIDNKELSMADFTILDANENALVLSGKINTESLLNPKFDLSLKADNFRILNATKKDNETLYGNVTFNANATLTGDLHIPKIDTDFTLGKDTNVTYVMPSNYADVEERDGVVVFVNRKHPDAILTQVEEKQADIINGFDIYSRLKINKEAIVNIIIDKNTGDNFRVSGDGDFNFRMIPNGRISLNGIYEVYSGHYELTLYNLVNRKFLLAPGGRVSWSGDPFNARLNVSAIYNVDTAALPLMESLISSGNDAEKNKYKQSLPFQVYLNIGGELMEPKISFSLDMPKDKQGAIGGQVYGRVQQINQQEEELNKQVFSLLVLSRFYPNTGSDGSLGGFTSIARNNLNAAVASELNSVSNKVLGNSGIKLDFGLNSFTDYQGGAPIDRTQLDIAAQEKFFDDRLTLRVGSEIDIQGTSAVAQETPIIGNVSLEYQLTKDGRYRIKGFRKSEFENVIDGQTIVTGIGLIFTQEFNKFNELWNAILHSKKNKEIEAKKLKSPKKVIKN